MTKVVDVVLAALLLAAPPAALAQAKAADVQEPRATQDAKGQAATEPQAPGAQGTASAIPDTEDLSIEVPDPKAKDAGRQWFADCSDKYAIRLGCVLRIRATGQYAKDIQEAGANKIRLVLDDVPIPELLLEFEESARDKGLLVNITLKRDSESNENRKAWDQVFKKHGDWLMKVGVALEIDGTRTIRARPERIPFYVASGKLVWTVVVAGLLAFLGAFWWLIKNDAVLRDWKGGSYSLGKTQMAFWGLIVVLCFLGLWIVTGAMERIPGQVLVLIGISASTGLGAVLIGSSNRASRIKERQDALTKLETDKAAQLADPKSPESSQKERLTREIALLGDPGSLAQLTDERTRLQRDAVKELQHPQSAEAQRLKQIEGDLKVLYDLGFRPPAERNFLRDILDDGNGVSLHRLQTAVWSVVLGMVFIRSVSQTMTMPEFSDTLLTLMAISNGTYLGFKFPEKPTT